MCDCIEKVNKSLAEANTNTQIKRLMLVQGLTAVQVGASLFTEVINPGNTKKPIAVSGSFCPFCGEKLA